MKFYLQSKDGKRRELTMSEAEEHLSKYQIEDAIDAKRSDPEEEVSYMTVDGGFIIVEF